MKKCSICRKNIAIIFTTKLDVVDKTKTMIGLCITCAKKLKVPGIEMIEQMNIDDDVINNLNLDEINLDDIDIENLSNSIKQIDLSKIDLNNGKYSNIMNELFNNIKNNNENKDSDKKDENIAYYKSELNDDEINAINNNDVKNSNYNNLFNDLINEINNYSKNQNDSNEESEEEEENEEKNSNQKEIDKKRKKRKNIEKYSTYLLDKIKNNEIDDVIGRNNEISRIIAILARKTKNNPILIGEAGVGKTAITEGLALRINNKEVPALLLNKELYDLDITNVVAGTNLRGQFEQRMSQIIKEAKEDKNIILIIDEIHKLIGAGDVPNGNLDAANILKPALSKGDIQVIGITTEEEYRKYIEKDPALNRRFQPIFVDEPSIEDSIKILNGIKKFYEDFHNVTITDDAIIQSVKLSKRYITDRYLPDKAIDLIDEACAKLKLLNNENINDIKNQIKDVIKEKEEKYNKSEMEEYYKLSEFEIELKKKLKKELDKKEYNIVDANSITVIIEELTKIPVTKLTEQETNKLINLENSLKKSIIGQDEAVEKISKTIRRNRVGFRNNKKPSSFMFVGPTGVGKTQLAKKLSEEIFGSDEHIIRLDMSEYMEQHSSSKLIGAPPGYVGYDDSGTLVKKVKRNPYSIILFDEIEKAHHDIYNLLLQILDDGRLTDNKGKTVHFENTVIIMTSNAGSNLKNNSIGFNEDTKEIDYKNKVNESLKSIFKPEFLNRIDDIIVFNHLSKSNIKEIINLQLEEYNENLKEFDICIKYDDSVIEYLLDKGYDNVYGARPMKRQIQSLIENKLSDLYLLGHFKKSDNLFIKMNEEKNDIIVEVI